MSPNHYQLVADDTNAYLDFTLTDPTGEKILRQAELAERQLAFHLDFTELKPGTRYNFSYQLISRVTLENQVLDSRSDGTFKTFAEDP